MQPDVGGRAGSFSSRALLAEVQTTTAPLTTDVGRLSMVATARMHASAIDVVGPAATVDPDIIAAAALSCNNFDTTEVPEALRGHYGPLFYNCTISDIP
jgi:hypothetical protein